MLIIPEIPNNITREHIISAIKRFDEEGLPDSNADSQYYDLLYNEKRYPPKVIVSYENKFAIGEDLNRQNFSGGVDSQSFKLLEAEGFEIVPKNNPSDDMLKKQFLKILDNYPSSRNDPYPGDGEMAQVIKNQLPEYLNNMFGTLLHEGSAGKGNWAAVPWVASMDENLTTTVSKGV